MSSSRPRHLPLAAAADSGTGSPTSSDTAAVALLLGREPFTRYRVSVRCPFGAPAVIESEPVDRHGRPFPTRNWLTCRALVSAVSRLEAEGGVRALEADPSLADSVREAHAAHARAHAGHRVGGVADERRVKCLHAHLAFALASGGSPVGDWIWDRAGAAWPKGCCVEGFAGGGA